MGEEVWLAFFFLHRAGVQAEDGIGRAELENRCCQGNYADPAPHAYARHCHADQRQPDYDAQDPVDGTYICFHDALHLFRQLQFSYKLMDSGAPVCEKSHKVFIY